MTPQPTPLSPRLRARFATRASHLLAVASTALFCTVCAPAVLADPAPPATPGTKVVPDAAIGFSNLVIRLEGQDEIGLAGADYRVRLIERIRQKGYRAVGAENLVFNKDDSHLAAFQIGGNVRELACRKLPGRVRCRVGVEWQLLDVARDTVVYKVMTRFAVMDLPANEVAGMGSKLLVGALDSMLDRPRFRAALKAAAPDRQKANDPAFPRATFAGCSPPAKKMPDAAEQVLGATVVVRSGETFGSGFFITADGLVLTAAHVVETPTLTLRLRNGTQLEAVPVRIAPEADVALLRPTRQLASQSCLAIKAGDTPIGAELYALGAPASMDLAFSVTRGIVSAVREFHGQNILQTDAPISPGNSGGPLMGTDATVVAIASAKLAGRTIEGIAFGIPIRPALAALSLEQDTTTDALLWSAPPPSAGHEEKKVDDAAITDTEDAVQSLDPEGDSFRAAEAATRQQQLERVAYEEAKQEREEWREARRDAITPWYVDTMKWSGIALASVGGVVGLVTYSRYDAAQTTRDEFNSLRMTNTIGWAAFAVGAGAFTTSCILRPPLPPETSDDNPTSRAGSRLSVGPGSVSWEGRF